jgi:hypothetical protein
VVSGPRIDLNFVWEDPQMQQSQYHPYVDPAEDLVCAVAVVKTQYGFPAFDKSDSLVGFLQQENPDASLTFFSISNWDDHMQQQREELTERFKQWRLHAKKQGVPASGLGLLSQPAESVHDGWTVVLREQWPSLEDMKDRVALLHYTREREAEQLQSMPAMFSAKHGLVCTPSEEAALFRT